MTDPHAAARLWAETLQLQLMAALDAAWALAQASDDPAVIARARDKARLCGQIAAEARKVAALAPPPRRAGPGPVSREMTTPGATPKAGAAETQAILAAPPKPPATQADITRAAFERLKADGRRGR